MAQLHRGTEGQSFSHKCKMLELLCHENMSETNGSLLSFVPSERLVTLLSTSDIVKFDYVATPGRMTTRARKRIFDWVIAMSKDFGFSIGTIGMCMQLIDGCIGRLEIEKGEFSLLPLVALMIASKFNETNPILMKEAIHVGHGQYAKKDIQQMEVKMLTALQWTVPHARVLRIVFQVFQDVVQFVSSSQVVLEMWWSTAQKVLHVVLGDYACSRRESSVMAYAVIGLIWRVHPVPWSIDTLKNALVGNAKDLVETKDCLMKAMSLHPELADWIGERTESPTSVDGFFIGYPTRSKRKACMTPSPKKRQRY